VIDYIALAMAGLTNPDHRPDNTGLDDGPTLPRWILNADRKAAARTLVARGATLRAAAYEVGLSHETVRVCTDGITKRRHVSGGRTRNVGESA
jgi:hypothetical protein